MVAKRVVHKEWHGPLEVGVDERFIMSLDPQVGDEFKIMAAGYKPEWIFRVMRVTPIGIVAWNMTDDNDQKCSTTEGWEKHGTRWCFNGRNLQYYFKRMKLKWAGSLKFDRD